MKETNTKENVGNRVIDLITKGSGDRLIVFKPKEDIGSINLTVKKRGEYDSSVTSKPSGNSSKIQRAFFNLHKTVSRELFLQTHIFIGPNKTGNISEDILQKEFVPTKNFYLLFVYFNEVKQNINNIWMIPSPIFSEMAELQKSENGKLILRFKTTIITGEKDKYKRFQIEKKDLGGFLLRIIEGKNNNFGANNFKNNKIIDLDKIKKFIIEARENTFAVNSKPTENPRLFGSTQMEYQKTDYFYQDIYFKGAKISIGQEVIYYNDKPIWAMNYIGNVIEKNGLEFLKKSLLELSSKCRFGGKCQFSKKEFEYQDEGQGDLEYFSGKEQILQNGKNVYNLTYLGGLISK